MTSKPPYAGKKRCITVFGINVGTTLSAYRCQVLDPREEPQIFSVTYIPSGIVRTKLSREVEIPSVLYYSEDGEVCAIGPEAQARSAASQLEAMTRHGILVG
ncbi:uncharacterized protein LAESUDRAFT_242058 [Laetiporus sulphureus 93-53]|uniref:Uncharacterized protein n=1 Tax=Laetiporus sulphureus 93-53 TaxID=1314785 RepID=A0A165DKR3_9APHY|nr:uncharacterized protein LAESUDRAFT_242058 [Laetiporus sulphureus 93-53]KZT05099.1 hypothetical protein LAESUDRAFT_242058 [Laetiporus sulphureus 93-53]